MKIPREAATGTVPIRSRSSMSYGPLCPQRPVGSVPPERAGEDGSMYRRARRGRSTVALGLVFVAFATAGLVSCTSDPPYCSAPAGADKHVWTGATNDLWTTNTNWDTNDVPGSGAGSADDYACIPSGKSVRVGTPGQGVAIDLLAVDSRGTLQ